MKIFKYPLSMTDFQHITIPADARALSVGLDPAGDLCLWALVDPSAPQYDTLKVCVIGTGNPVPTEALSMTFLGTVTMSPFVWHVFVS